MTGQTPSDEKVSMEFQMSWRFFVQEISYHRFVQTGPLYRDIGAVIFLITSPRFSEACEFGDNFLNGWKLLMEINCSKNFGRQSWIY